MYIEIHTALKAIIETLLLIDDLDKPVWFNFKNSYKLMS